MQSTINSENTAKWRFKEVRNSRKIKKRNLIKGDAPRCPLGNDATGPVTVLYRPNLYSIAMSVAILNFELTIDD